MNVRWAPRTDTIRAAVEAERVAVFADLCHSLEARTHEHLDRYAGQPRSELLRAAAGALATLRGRSVDSDEIHARTCDLDDAALAADAAKLEARAEIWLKVLERGREVEVALRACDEGGTRVFTSVDAFRALAPSVRRDIVRAFYLTPPRPDEWAEEMSGSRAPNF